MGELESTLSGAELSEWEAFHQVEPLPDPYWTAALQCQVMASLWSKRRYTLADFLPVADRAAAPEPEETAEQSLQKFMQLVGGHNGRRNGPVHK